MNNNKKKSKKVLKSLMNPLSRATLDVLSVTIPSYSGFCHCCSPHQNTTYFSPSAQANWFLRIIKKNFFTKIGCKQYPLKEMNW